VLQSVEVQEAQEFPAVTPEVRWSELEKAKAETNLLTSRLWQAGHRISSVLWMFRISLSKTFSH
jgi:hypothetical protein